MPSHLKLKHRFQNLYGLLNTDSLYQSWGQLNKHAKPGIDGISMPKYKEKLTENIDRISRRQWINLGMLLVLPFSPLISYLFYPEHFGFVALGILPLLALSSWDNTSLTSKYLDASELIANSTKKNAIDKYLCSLELEIKKEVVIFCDTH